MLNEDTYIAEAYFYDTTAWSQPLLLDIAGGSRTRADARTPARSERRRVGARAARSPAGPPAAHRRVPDVRRLQRRRSPTAGCAGRSTTTGTCPYRERDRRRHRRRRARLGGRAARARRARGVGRHRLLGPAGQQATCATWVNPAAATSAGWAASTWRPSCGIGTAKLSSRRPTSPARSTGSGRHHQPALEGHRRRATTCSTPATRSSSRAASRAGGRRLPGRQRPRLVPLGLRGRRPATTRRPRWSSTSRRRRATSSPGPPTRSTAATPRAPSG